VKHKKHTFNFFVKLFHPKEHKSSVQSINLNKLKRKGIKGLIVDLDETLRKRNSSFIPKESLKWVQEAKNKGFKVCVISNNIFPWKRKKIQDKFHVPIALFSLKPLPFAIKKAMSMLKTNEDSTALIGDQLYSDILGANMLGLHSILVDPMSKTEKGPVRRMVRWIERKIYTGKSA